jgi:hypothetical protein
MASGMALHDVLPGSELVGMTSSVIVLVALGVEKQLYGDVAAKGGHHDGVEAVLKVVEDDMLQGTLGDFGASVVCARGKRESLLAA